jgi:hypothetical protein
MALDRRVSQRSATARFRPPIRPGKAKGAAQSGAGKPHLFEFFLY